MCFRSFAKNRLNALLRTQAFGALASLVPRITDMFVSGSVVGVDALAGIAAVMPVTIGALFVGEVVCRGAGYLFARRQGEFQRARAREVVGMTLTLTVLAGLLIWAAMFLGRDLYFDLMGLEGPVREQAASYWRVTAVYLAFYPFTTAMWRFVYADGETVVTVLGDVIQPFLTLALAIPLARSAGSAGGSALGTLIARLTADSIMMLHLFRKSNAVVPKWCLSPSLAKEIVLYSLADASSRLCQCGFLSVVNRLVVGAGSMRFLPVVGVSALVLEVREAMDRAGDAYAPVAEMYIGEGNRPRLRELVRCGLGVSTLAGAVCAAALIAFAPQVVTALGIPRGEIFAPAVSALRICACALPFSAMMAFLISHLLAVNRVSLSFAGTLLEQFVLTTGCTVALCGLWGVDLLWAGMPLGAVLSLMVIAAYCWFRDGTAIPEPAFEKGNAILNVTFRPASERIVEMRNEVEAFLSAHGVSRETVGRVALLAEECAMALVDRHGGRTKRILAETSVTVGKEGVRAVFRDTGDMGDVTDGDAPVSSLRAFVIAGLVRVVQSRQYLNTIGCNRAMFTFAFEF